MKMRKSYQQKIFLQLNLWLSLKMTYADDKKKTRIVILYLTNEIQKHKNMI